MSLPDRTGGKTPREWVPQIVTIREYGTPGKARYSHRARRQASPVAGTWVEPRGRTPAPQGAGVCASGNLREVIEMTDDDTGTTRRLWCTIHLITHEEEENDV